MKTEELVSRVILYLKLSTPKKALSTYSRSYFFRHSLTLWRAVKQYYDNTMNTPRFVKGILFHSTSQIINFIPNPLIPNDSSVLDAVLDSFALFVRTFRNIHNSGWDRIFHLKWFRFHYEFTAHLIEGVFIIKCRKSNSSSVFFYNIFSH